MMEDPERGDLARAISKMKLIRPRSAVPMLLKRAATRQHPSDTQLMGYAFSVLTGQSMDRSRGVNTRGAIKVYRGWWQTSRDTFTTDICKMSEASRLRVIRLMAARSWGGTAANWGAAAVSYSRSAPRGDVFGASLCPGMVEDLLYVVDEKGLRWGATKMLATLYKRGDAPQLERVMRSRESSSAARLTSLLALAEAGEPMQQKLLLEMFKKESDADLQEAMIYAMGRCDASVVAVLIEEVEGPHHRAAVVSLRHFDSSEAVAPLRRILLKTPSSNGMRHVTSLLARIRTKAAIEALAANLERLSRLENRPEDWGNTLRDFSGATGNRDHLGGARSVEAMRESASLMLADWRASKARQ